MARSRARCGGARRELGRAACGRALVQAPRHVARGRAAEREFRGLALSWRCAGAAPGAGCRARRRDARRACSAIRLSDAKLRGTTMKYGAFVLCATFTLLGSAAPAFAADAPAGSNLQAGGLKPPDAVESEPNPT